MQKSFVKNHFRNSRHKPRRRRHFIKTAKRRSNGNDSIWDLGFCFTLKIKLQRQINNCILPFF